MKTIFFDYDGTIHESMHIYRPAVHKAIEFLNTQGYDIAIPTESMFFSFIGKNPTLMWSEFAGDVSEELRQQASMVVSKTMEELILSGCAQWYSDARKTLETLKEQGHQLILISNCKNYYMESHNRMFQLDQIFDMLMASEAYGYQSKSAMIDQVKDQMNQELIMVGDRVYDIEAGKAHGMKTFGAAYGYGRQEELADADIILSSIQEILHYIE